MPLDDEQDVRRAVEAIVKSHGRTRILLGLQRQALTEFDDFLQQQSGANLDANDLRQRYWRVIAAVEAQAVSSLPQEAGDLLDALQENRQFADLLQAYASLD